MSPRTLQLAVVWLIAPEKWRLNNGGSGVVSWDEESGWRRPLHLETTAQL